MLMCSVNGYSYGLTYTEVMDFTLADLASHAERCRRFFERHNKQ